MSYHILHLIGPELRIRIDHERFAIEEKLKNRTSHVPIEDVAIVVSSAPDLVLTGAALRKMAERRIVHLVCDDRHRPAAIMTPYYGVTSNETFHRQLAWTAAFRRAAWRRIVSAKIRAQADALPPGERLADRLRRFADAFERRRPTARSTAEATAARWYWGVFFGALGERLARRPGTRAGVNGLLDYGYAIVRSAVLRSLACHGFISALGLSHTTKPGGHPLADDLVEPLRGFVDLRLREWIEAGGDPNDHRAWVPAASAILTRTVRMGRSRFRLLYAIDRMVESLGEASARREAALLRFPAHDAARPAA